MCAVTGTRRVQIGKSERKMLGEEEGHDFEAQ